MIQVSFPDGSIKEVEAGSTPLQLAEGISPRLAKAALGALVNGAPWDLTRALPGDCTLQILTWNDAAGREIYRHSSTHLMAQAVQALYPDAKLTVGPPLEDRFYYDIDMAPISEDDFAKIEEKMREFARANLPIEREELSREEARELFANDKYKLELLQDVPEGETISVYRQGDWICVAARTFRQREYSRRSNSCRSQARIGAAMPATNSCSGFTARVIPPKKNWTRILNGSNKRSCAIIASWGANWTCSCFRPKSAPDFPCGYLKARCCDTLWKISFATNWLSAATSPL